MTANILAGIALHVQQLSRRWTSSGQAILGKIIKAIVALVEHLLTAGFDAVAPKHVHVFDVLVVIPRCYPIDGIANVEHERRIVKAVRPKVVVDVAVDHLGQLSFDISIQRKSHDRFLPAGIFGAVIRIGQGSADVAAETGPTGLANVKEADGLLPGGIVRLNILGQTSGMAFSGILEPVAKVPLALLVAVLHGPIALLHVVKGFVHIHEGREAARFLLLFLPQLATSLNELRRGRIGQGSFLEDSSRHWTLEQRRSVRRRGNANATTANGDEVPSRSKVYDATDNADQQNHKAEDARAQGIHIDPNFVGID